MPKFRCGFCKDLLKRDGPCICLDNSSTSHSLDNSSTRQLIKQNAVATISGRLTEDGVIAVATVRGVGGLQQMPCPWVDNHVDEVALVGRVKVTQPFSFFPSHLLIILTDQTQDVGLALPHLCNNTK